MRRIQLITTISELIIPLLLFFVWDWSLHYILIFIYFDVLASLALAFVKENKLCLAQNIKEKKSKFKLFLYAVYVLAGILLLEFSMGQLDPDMNFLQSYHDFMMVKEFGIPQIFLLVPLIFVLNMQQYKTMFINLKLHEKLPLAYLRNQHRTQMMMFLAQGLLFCMASFLLPNSEVLFLTIFLVFKALSDLVIAPYLEQKFIERFVTLQHGRKG